MSNSLDPDQARRFVGPDLGPNCLQKLSFKDFFFVATSGERVKAYIAVYIAIFVLEFDQVISSL